MKLRLFVMVCVLGLALAGCKGKSVKEEGEDTEMSESAAMDEDSEAVAGVEDSDSNNAMGLQTINFPYDSYEITETARSILSENTRILTENPNLMIQVEGHCDERGSIQYNIALGEKRAMATKKYLLNLGLTEDRITIISYGKEKPVAMGSDEESWAANRRANFVITSK